MGGAGEPVQIGGLVPGCVAMGSYGVQALSTATGATSRTAAALLEPKMTGLTMRRSLSDAIP